MVCHIICCFRFASPENLEAIEKGQAGLHYSKQNAPESKLSSSVQGEATPTKTLSYSTPSPACSPAIKQELFAAAHQQTYRLEKLHPNIRVEKTEPRTPTKAELSRGETHILHTFFCFLTFQNLIRSLGVLSIKSKVKGEHICLS